MDEKLNEVTQSVISLETKFANLETKFANLETKFEMAQVKMQQMIITTMKWYVSEAGVVLVLLKALDIFLK